MKFDIVAYIADQCNNYLQGCHTKAFTLDAIVMALEKNSWQRDCDGKEVVDDFVEADTGRYWAHEDWCVRDETEDK